jgi:hypothetical protein
MFEQISCGTCGGEGVYLGQLGRLMWFRCRACGLDFSQAEEFDVAQEHAEEA